MPASVAPALRMYRIQRNSFRMLIPPYVEKRGLFSDLETFHCEASVG